MRTGEAFLWSLKSKSFLAFHWWKMMKSRFALLNKCYYIILVLSKMLRCRRIFHLCDILRWLLLLTLLTVFWTVSVYDGQQMTRLAVLSYRQSKIWVMMAMLLSGNSMVWYLSVPYDRCITLWDQPAAYLPLHPSSHGLSICFMFIGSISLGNDAFCCCNFSVRILIANTSVSLICAFLNGISDIYSKRRGYEKSIQAVCILKLLFNFKALNDYNLGLAMFQMGSFRAWCYPNPIWSSHG